ncbi:MAG: hypothetical protein AAB911_01000 [Patescibacteria group bacterium]
MPLTKKQELFEKIAKGDKKAIGKLTNVNLFLVRSIAKRYKDNNHYLSYETLVEIGKSGLLGKIASGIGNILKGGKKED